MRGRCGQCRQNCGLLFPAKGFRKQVIHRRTTQLSKCRSGLYANVYVWIGQKDVSERVGCAPITQLTQCSDDIDTATDTL